MKETDTQAGAITDRTLFKDVKEMGTKEKWTDYTLESNIIRVRTMNLHRHELNADAIFSTKLIRPFLTLPWHSGLTLPLALCLSPLKSPVGDSLEFACTPVPALFTKFVTCPGEKQRESLGQRIRWNLTEMPAHAHKGACPSQHGL